MIKAKVLHLAEKINAPKSLLPAFDVTEIRNDGHPLIEIDSKGYHFVIIEKK